MQAAGDATLQETLSVASRRLGLLLAWKNEVDVCGIG